MKTVLFIMPFGEKKISYKDEDEIKYLEIDFDKEFHEISEKLEEITPNQFTFHRVDNIVGTDIFNKMYNSIFAADIVLADLTGLNENVMYELGMRHALRDKITVMYKNKLSNHEKIPFDIGTYVIYKTKDEIINNWKKIVSDNKFDSPIYKEVPDDHVNIEKIEEAKKIFDNYATEWEEYSKELKKLESKNWSDPEEGYKKIFKFLDSKKISFIGNYAYDLKLALYTYKKDEKNLQNLKDAFQIIENKNPLNTNDVELSGLACSITRKMYELKNDVQFKRLSNQYSMSMVSKFPNNVYSLSSYILNLMSQYERGDVSFDYLIESVKMNEFNLNDANFNDDYYEETYNLYKIFLCDDLSEIDISKYKNSKNHNELTSKNAVLRAVEIMKNK